jgi:hypothetical protein
MWPRRLNMRLRMKERGSLMYKAMWGKALKRANSFSLFFCIWDTTPSLGLPLLVTLLFLSPPPSLPHPHPFPIGLIKVLPCPASSIFPTDFSRVAYSSPWWWRQYTLPKCWSTLRLCGAISQEAVIFSQFHHKHQQKIIFVHCKVSRTASEICLPLIFRTKRIL